MHRKLSWLLGTPHTAPEHRHGARHGTVCQARKFLRDLDYYIYDKGVVRAGPSFFGGELNFTAEFVCLQYVMLNYCETIFLIKWFGTSMRVKAK